MPTTIPSAANMRIAAATGVTIGWSRAAGYWIHPVLRYGAGECGGDRPVVAQQRAAHSEHAAGVG
jgi:hypothetical protein